MGTTEDLFSAIAVGADATIERLVGAEPALLEATHDGVTLIRGALYNGQRETADVLLRLGAVPDAFDAAALGDEPLLRALIDEDPSVATAISGDGFSALHLAAWFGYPKVAGLLIAKGADPECIATNGTLLRPLHSAAAGGHETIAHLLLDRGADIETEQQGGIRPLHSAAHRNDVAMVKLLLDRGADPAATTEDGRTPRTLATDPTVLALLPTP